MNRTVEFTHKDGKITLVRADSLAQGKRKFIQMGFSISDVVSWRLIRGEEIEEENG